MMFFTGVMWVSMKDMLDFQDQDGIMIEKSHIWVILRYVYKTFTICLLHVRIELGIV